MCHCFLTLLQVRGFKLSQDDGFLRVIKIHSTSSFRGEVKPSAPCKILWHTKNPFEVWAKMFWRLNSSFSSPSSFWFAMRWLYCWWSQFKDGLTPWTWSSTIHSPSHGKHLYLDCSPLGLDCKITRKRNTQSVQGRKASICRHRSCSNLLEVAVV
jgi:hypothetical protein